MPGTLIVTATDSTLFWLAKGLVLSVAESRQTHDLAMVCLDLGLTETQRSWMSSQDVRLEAPPDILGAAGLEGFRPYMLGQLCRPFLPTILPGHDSYIWLDADVWVQQPDGIGGLLHVMRFGHLACCPELHAAYSGSRGPATRHLAFWQTHWTAVFGPDDARRYAPVPMLNSGVIGAPADHPVWARWEAELRIAIQRPLTHLTEQLAFFRAAIDRPNVERLPAQWNWLANFARPKLNPRTRLWIEPTYPHQPIRIMHLAAATLREKYLRKRMLFQGGDYLEPGEGPATGAEDEPVAAG